MRSARVLCVALALLGASVPARAQATHVVAVSNFSFAPALVVAEAGDTVRWTWRSGTHSVVDAATNDDLCAMRSAPADDCTFTVPGGPEPFRLSYYCGVHPNMQAEITTDAPPQVAITSPRNGEIVTTPVTFTGTVSDDGPIDAVRLTARMSPLALVSETRVATCPDCASGASTWSTSIALLPGRYTVSAVAQAGAGVALSPTITIVVI